MHQTCDKGTTADTGNVHFHDGEDIINSCCRTESGIVRETASFRVRSRPACGMVRGMRAMLLLPMVAYALAQTPTVKLAKPAKVHTVTLGAVRKVPFTPADVTPEDHNEETTTLKVRPLFVDEREREWTMGEMHDVTDRSFAIRRVMRVNDALPGDKAEHWTWEPGPWLLVDRVTGRITALRLPEFDAAVSNVVWYRDYAAYCGIGTTAKGGLYAMVAQLGVRRPVVQKLIGPWPQEKHSVPVCQPAEWERTPMRVILKPTGGDPLTFEVMGTVGLVEEGDDGVER